VKTILPLLILFAGFTVGSCSPSSGSPSGDSGDVAPSGASLFNAHCATCHGGTGSGSAMGFGPSLHGLAEHWEAGSLEAYLSDPAGYSGSVGRLGSRPMPAWPKSLSAGERAALVDHALGLMR
jgi:mono/diheme cytochrome c family protein